MRDPASNNTDNKENNPNNLPELIYCENVMPAPDGLTTVITQVLQAAFPIAGHVTSSIYILRDSAENSWYFAPAQGRNYVSAQLGVDPWVSKSPLGAAPINIAFSIAYVNGVTYICYDATYIGHWDAGLNDFVDDSASVLGILPANIRSIAGVGNYLVAITGDEAVNWSSLTNPLDFTPSALTGAGRQVPVDIRGAPHTLTPMTGGFLIHCVDTTIAAFYTNNASAPWIFREVKNAGGFPSGAVYYRTKDDAGGLVYIYGTKGIQQLDLREAVNVYPDANYFIGDGVLETFDTATNLLTVTRTGHPLGVRLKLLLNRYFCISYGGSAVGGGAIANFAYVLLYDMVLHRWGKVKVDHGDIFAISTADDVLGSDDIIDSITLLQVDGTCLTLKMSGAVTADAGVAIFGRYQISRTRNIVSQQCELEVLDASDSVSVFVAANYNGTTAGVILPMVLGETTDNYRLYQKQVEAENLTYILKGNFKLSTMLLTVTPGGNK